MAIPYTFQRVLPQDVRLEAFPVYKRYTLSSSALETTASGYCVVDGLYKRTPTPIGSNKAENDPINSADGSYKHVMWKFINKMWYKDGYDSSATLEHANKRYTYKFLNISASMLSIPYMKYGESIRPGSTQIVNRTGNYTLKDDKDGNLYDISMQTGSFSKAYALVGYWSFNDQFLKFENFGGSVTNASIGYVSREFEVDDHSAVKNVTFAAGVPVSGSPSGMAAEFSGDGYILTHDRPEFNFPTNEDFTIAMWAKVPVSQSILARNTNTLLSKRGTIRKLVYGVEEKYNSNNIRYDTKHVSSSIADDHTDMYPYDIDVYNTGASAGKIRFRRSDGSSVLELISTGSINDGQYHHIAVSKLSSNIRLYVDGALHATGTELGTHPINKHSIIFGATSRDGTGGYSGSLDEVRIYSYGLTQPEIATLADNTTGGLYQTSVVGNVFYRSGHVVVTPLLPKYIDALHGDYTLSYRGTHTIYQYEILCRVRAGSFNLTYNPTARLSPKSDLLIPDMTGSFLLPYATEIGLYNNMGNLVAVGKLGSAVQMRDDVDLNFLIRFDA